MTEQIALSVWEKQDFMQFKHKQQQQTQTHTKYL